MKDKNVRVIIVKCDDEARGQVIPNELSKLQEIVGEEGKKALIEFYPLDEENICIICDEEGKLKDLQPNGLIGEEVIVGDFLVVQCDEEGEIVSMSEETMNKYLPLFNLLSGEYRVTEDKKTVELNPIYDIDQISYSVECPQCGESVYITFDNAIPFPCVEDVECTRCHEEFLVKVLNTENI